ncbi:MAG TPA: bifunctional phosphoribosylaminoimidazolecarboxamide formyltransferase/IMP cyclohydrolase [Gemmataceae bacterium]|jgi:phosphoribosylaminoimidazolecarboxamide formyltransferase/IMP cyclohydrolase|nr:bifunctional phosphoribosylaminoimidazolecarboxamide formyltransferase/IMP cyclohydrolase [Gemmataceae bacterium]
MPIRLITRALLSVSDKTGLLEFASGLAACGVEIISTGGTRRALADAGLAVRDISEITGFPEILDGRVKTLHPKVHGGILAIREHPQHQTVLQEQDIGYIDLVVVNLYPFERTVANPASSHEQIIENIDIGGPSMIRSAAKNYHDVTVVTDPADYEEVLREIRQHNGTRLGTRERLAAKAFARTARYDAAIAAYFQKRLADIDPVAVWPSSLTLSFELRSKLRYGENPHQKAAFYVEPQIKHVCLAGAEVLHGKELSYNNLLDLDSALNLVREFAEPAAVVLKHNNPCGAAVAATLEQAFDKAYEGDPLSAFGGILGFNRALDEATALRISEPNRFIECIIAPDYDAKALEILATRPKWGKNVRLLKTGPLGPALPSLDFRRVDGGLLVQDRDIRSDEDLAAAEVKTKRPPTEAERADLAFAWKVCKHVKSNAIVLARQGMLVGAGAGQMSRVDSVQIAVRKAGERSKGSVLASDAFFPFRDNVDVAAAAGVTAIVQPGGSVKDADSIAACDEHGIAMIFTRVRHFRH